jgi:hypothetical protein
MDILGLVVRQYLIGAEVSWDAQEVLGAWVVVDDI